MSLKKILFSCCCSSKQTQDADRVGNTSSAKTGSYHHQCCCEPMQKNNLQNAHTRINGPACNNNQHQQEQCEIYKSRRPSSTNITYQNRDKFNKHSNNHSFSSSYNKKYRRSSHHSNAIMLSSQSGVQIRQANIVRFQNNALSATNTSDDDPFFSCTED